MAERAAVLGAEVVQLKAHRLTGLDNTYRHAKTTMAVVVASPSRRKPQPIPPSADWRFDLAEGCPAHCAYCYLAGSLAGPPIIRAYANLPEILAALPPLLGQGQVTSRNAARAAEGTTFEASCYTDPLGIPAAWPRRSGSSVLGRQRRSSVSQPSMTPSARCWTYRTTAARASASPSMRVALSASKAGRRACGAGFMPCARPPWPATASGSPLRPS